MKRVIFTLLGMVALVAALAPAALAGDKLEGPNGEHKVVVCKYVSIPGVGERLQTGDNPIWVDYHSVPGFDGTFPFDFADAQGNSKAVKWSLTDGTLSDCPGEVAPPDECPNLEGIQATVPEGMVKNEQGECVTPPPVDYCETLPGVQAEDEDCPAVIAHVTAGVTFNEATCTSGPSFVLLKTNPGLRFYNVEGPFVDGKPVAGGTYTITPILDEGFVLDGQATWTFTFAVPSNCSTTPPCVYTGAGKDGQEGNDDCLVVTPPVTTVTVPAATPVAVVTPVKPPAVVKPKPHKPVAKPKPKPTKPKAKPVKPKKHAPVKLPKPDKPKKAPKTL